MRKLCVLLLALLGWTAPAFAQVGAGATLPATCTSGGAFYLTTGSVGMYVCASANTWTLAGQPAGGAAWGSVTGTLANQSDLQTALDGKQASGTYATGSGTASGTNTGDQTTVSGNAGTATKLATARAINGVNFDGSAAITVPAAGSTLTDLVTVAKGGTGVAVLPAGTMALPANQTGNATSTFKMNGLGAAAAPCTITPVATGRVLFNITGSIGNGTTADSVTWKLAYGTGTAPANAAAATGTVLGAVGVFKALTGQLDSPFASIGLATGLALNTAVWYDLQIADITGGTVTATAVTCTAVEY